MKLIKFILNRVVETSMKLAKKTILGASRPEILTFINSEEGPDGLIKPLSSSFYSNLLRLEDKIQRKDFSENTINEIILLYAKCVEYYDCLKDPIKNYFLEKMQNTLVSKEALAALIKTNNQEEKEVEKNSYNLRSFEGIYSTKNKANYDTKQNLKNFVERIENYKKMKKGISQRYSYSKKKFERIKKMNFFLEWQERTNSEELNMDSIMKNYHIITKENDEIVAGDINSQLENLNYKLEKRKLLNSLKKNQYDPSFLSNSFYSKDILNDFNAIAKFSLMDDYSSNLNMQDKGEIESNKLIKLHSSFEHENE